MKLIQKEAIWKEKEKKKSLTCCFNGDLDSYHCHAAAIDVDEEVPTSLS